MDYQQMIINGAKELGITISEETAHIMIEYMGFLLEWNERVNLTAIKKPEEIIVKHFLDSFTILPELNGRESLNCIDVGTGAGFPGVPAAIAAPGAQMTLCDSGGKRVTFLNALITRLSLGNCRTVLSRAEELGRRQAHREIYDVCVSRAVADLTALAEYCIPLVRVGGKFIAMKGKNSEAEIEKAQTAIAKLGGEITSVREASLPFSDIAHVLVIVRKLRETPPSYPRKTAKILKSALV